MDPTDRHTTTSQPAAVVFDLDGVLLDTTENMRCAFTACYRAAGFEGAPPFEKFLEHMGAPLPAILRTLGLPEEATEIYSRESTRELHRIRPYGGVPEILQALVADGIPIAVATGRSHARAMQALHATGLAPQLSAVIGSDLVTRPKPAPDIVHAALAALRPATGRVIRPESAIFVGDSVLDMRCGRAAGVIVVAAGWGQTDAATLLAERPDQLAAQPGDLVRALGLPVARLREPVVHRG